MISNKVKHISSLIFSSLLLFTSNSLFAEPDTRGSEEFRISCAICHGVGGRGNGNMAEYLKIVPSDLTVLAKNNEGRFPSGKVFRTIDGRSQVKGHGDRGMPVWGSRYKAEVGDMYGPFGGETAVRARILELVYYIESIQQ